MKWLMRMGSNPWVNFAMRLGCVLVYAVGLASVANALPPLVSAPARWLALFVLASHTLELLILMRHVRLYRGPIAASIMLAILFGSLHWIPLFENKRLRLRMEDPSID